MRTKVHSPDDIRNFFAWSDFLDRMVLRPLSHIAGNWETYWDHEEKQYEPEQDSFAADLNQVIELVALCPPPLNYHDHEDFIAEQAVHSSSWPIQKKTAAGLEPIMISFSKSARFET